MRQAAAGLPRRHENQGPTHGELFDPAGNPLLPDGVPLAGGRVRSGDDPALLTGLNLSPREAASRSLRGHVEAYVAAWMRDRKLPDDVVLVINNRVCPGPLSCRNLLGSVMKPGHRITVYETDPDGTLRRQPRVFTGTGERITT
ncbi:hypothetical protein Raf01_95430 [Rugosimonospora africana]|uniref:SCP1.201-like deaminase n=1 Tax=Rugosimonospora africana TaxID=556532 RepID=A0A8J3VWZ9_9ACTN|nr:hypothetical protein Raf01_95430 [Rugosimonospora africana]